jgi:hypothetical protein
VASLPAHLRAGMARFLALHLPNALPFAPGWQPTGPRGHHTRGGGGGGGGGVSTTGGFHGVTSLTDIDAAADAAAASNPPPPLGSLAAAATAAVDEELERQRAVTAALSPSAAVRDLTSAAAWRPVLRECLSIIEREYCDVKATRNFQINAGFLLIATSLALMVGSLQAAATAGHVAAGVMQTAGLTFVAAAAFSTLIHVEQRASSFAWLVGLGAVGACIMAYVTWQFGMPAWGITTALGLLTWAVLQLWVAFMSTTTEVRSFKRAVYQVRILMQRPPAVVA